MPACPINKVLQGQKALVTGANSGIGQAVALALANAGADVVVNYVSRPEAAQEVVAQITKQGGKAIAIRADVAKEEEVQAMFKQMFDEFGTIDILVNNAGLQKDSPFDKMTLADWQFVLNVNLTGQFNEACLKVVLTCLPSEVERIDRNAMSAETWARIKRSETKRLRRSCFHHLPRVDLHLLK